jgi:hypothetical protein
MLPGEDAAERVADPPRQHAVGLDPAVEGPLVEGAGEEIADASRRVGRIEEFAEPGAGDFITTFNAAEVA